MDNTNETSLPLSAFNAAFETIPSFERVSSTISPSLALFILSANELSSKNFFENHVT